MMSRSTACGISRALRLLCAIAASHIFPAWGQVSQEQIERFPHRTVTLVVPYAGIGGSDIIARLVGPRLSARWGQPVIVENRAGASGGIGASHVAKAAPDGHTLLMIINTFTMTPALYRSLPFDPILDFAPVVKLAVGGFTLAVSPEVQATSLPALIEDLRKRPVPASYGSPGNGTPQHLAMELLKSRYRIDALHVPYKAFGGALTDLAGGQVEMMFATVHSVLPLVQTGRLRLLGVTGAERHALLPQVPTFREQGVDAVEGVDAWYGVLAPARTPQHIVQRLHGDFADVMNSEHVRDELAKLGLAVRLGAPAQLGTLIRTDLQRWRKVVSDANIKLD
jgi:tripartite-type tricarboxylate transporter receptor subunit TctC